MTLNEKEQIQEKEEQKTNPWMWVAIFSSSILILWMVFGRNPPQIHAGWFILAGFCFVTYLYYKAWLLSKQVPSLPEMVDIIAKEELKHGCYLTKHPLNVLGEPIGQDFFAIKFLDMNRTYLMYNKIFMGRSIKDIYELQVDSDKSSIAKALLDKGVTKHNVFELES